MSNLVHNRDEAAQVIALAKKHSTNGASMQSSAELCVADAEELFAEGRFNYAWKRAFMSFRYSVGCFHPDFRKLEDSL